MPAAIITVIPITPEKEGKVEVKRACAITAKTTCCESARVLTGEKVD
jgi:hypothetical protein